MLMIFGKSIEGVNEEYGVYDKEAADEFVRQIDMSDAEERGILKKAKEIAKNMLKENVNMADISKLTGSDKKEIIKLSNNL